MLFEMALTLGVAAVVLELMLVYRYRLLLELFERNMMLGIAFSLVLSWLLGAAFEASGMTVFAAAIASTIVTALVYRSGALAAVDPLLHIVRR